MRNILLLCFVFAAAVISAAAQDRPRYVFNNFDTPNGVKVHTPPTPQPQPKSAKKTTAKTPTSNPKVQQTALTKQNSAPSMRMSSGRTMGSFSTGDSKVDGYIVDSTSRHNVDPLLVYATMSQESSFKPKAISYKGARGLMQLMPGTAARFGVTNIFDPKQNIEGGVKYLRFLLDTFKGDVKLTLAGYNAGEGAVMKYGYTIPPYAETQNYVARITARYEMIRDPKFAREVLRVNSAQPTGKNTKSVKAAPVYETASLAVKLPNGKIQLTTR